MAEKPLQSRGSAGNTPPDPLQMYSVLNRDSGEAQHFADLDEAFASAALIKRSYLIVWRSVLVEVLVEEAS